MNRISNALIDTCALLCGLALLALPAARSAAAPAVAAQSRLTFSAMQMDVRLDGEFHKFAADIRFDPAAPAKDQVDIDVDLDSVDTGSADGDKLLKGRSFFDTARFPDARFVSTAVQATAPGKYRATGRFTLKGRSVELVVPFGVRRDSGGTWFEGALPISRLAYGVGQGEWTDTGTLADEVQVGFKLYVRD